MPDFVGCDLSTLYEWDDSLFVLIHDRYHYVLSQIFKGFIFSASITTLAMTTERYIFVVHPNLSDKIQEKRYRVTFYVFVTCCALLMPLARVTDFMFRWNIETTVERRNWLLICFLNDLIFFNYVICFKKPKQLAENF